MRLHVARSALAILAGASIVSCGEMPTQPGSAPSATPAVRFDAADAPKIVISQVYGGGGNTGAIYKYDFIELYNPGATAVSLVGWSVQYTSAGGGATGWAGTTNLTGTIAAGGYYLVQEDTGAGGTTELPDPNDIGGIAMSATAGKVALVSSVTALVGACPTANTTVVDFVGYGTSASTGATCFEGTKAAPTLTNTTAAIRKLDGSQDTNDNAADFVSGAPNPRNGPGGGGTTVGPLDHVAVSGGSSVNVNGTVTLTAVLQDANNQSITDPAATYTWASSDETLALVQSTTANTATIKGLKAGAPVTITVTATSKGVTKPGTTSLTVMQGAVGQVTVGVGTSPLVIGYQTQMFVTGGSTDKSGNPVTSADVTWSTSNANILTVDARGVVSAVSDGSATITGTAADGSAGSFTLATEVPFYSSTARTGHNTEFGEPSDNDPSNDVIIARKQYTVSYNPQRGGPNWVSWDLSATHLGTRNRCNCYSADTALARLGYGQYMYNTADYTNGGYDRGHMQPSADQTTTDGENATTFFLTNFLPQAHGLNAGPWERLEIDLRDSVKAGREAYVIAGGVFTNGVGLGSVKNEGKIFIPNSTWKIVVLMPANTGLENVTSATDLNVIAVNMPNVETPGTNDWTNFKTTVQNIQLSTGYDFLAALPEAIECKVEVRNCAPAAHIAGAGVGGGTEGQTLTFDASTSSDADAGSTLSYLWSINGSTAGIEPMLSRTFTDNGTYAVRLIVSDQLGAADTATTMVTVLNVTPAVNAFDGGSANKAVAYTANGSFTDPGDDHWTATVDYGDGSGAQPLALAGKTFALSHAYAASGSYTVRVTVTETDAEAGSGSRTATVVVTNVAPTVNAFAGTTILPGESYSTSGSFADVDPDSWTATVDYGDGTGVHPLALTGHSFRLDHTYLKAGTFTVTVRVGDGEATSSGTATVTVKSAVQGVADVGASVATLALNNGQINSLRAKLNAASNLLSSGQEKAAKNVLEAFISELQAAMRSGRLSDASAAPIIAYAQRVIDSIDMP